MKKINKLTKLKIFEHFLSISYLMQKTTKNKKQKKKTKKQKQNNNNNKETINK